MSKEGVYFYKKYHQLHVGITLMAIAKPGEVTGNRLFKTRRQISCCSLVPQLIVKSFFEVNTVKGDKLSQILWAYVFYSKVSNLWPINPLFFAAFHKLGHACPSP